MSVSGVSLRLRSIRSLCAVAATIATLVVAERVAAAGTVDVLSAGAPSPQASGVGFTATVAVRSTGVSANVCVQLFAGASGGTIAVAPPQTRCAGTLADGQIAALTWPVTFTLSPTRNTGEATFTAVVSWGEGSGFFTGDAVTIIRAASPAQLGLTAVTPARTTVWSDQVFDVAVTVSNPAAAGSNSANIAAVTLAEATGGPQPACGPPTAGGSGPLAPQATRTFTFPCQSSVSGAFQLRAMVTGSDATTGQALSAGPLVSGTITVNSPAAGLSVTSVAPSPLAAASGQAITIDALVRNTALAGGHDVTALDVVLATNAPSSGNGSAIGCVRTSAPDASPLAPQAQRQVSFSCTGSGHGAFTFRAEATGSDGPAALSATGTSAAVTVTDALSPTVTIDPAPVPWSSMDLAFELTATDGAEGSGVASVTVQIDGGPLTETMGSQVSVSLTAEGQHTIAFFATDRAGNNSATTAVTAGLDRTAPVITGMQSPLMVNGWNNSPVTVTFTCSDALSQVQSCSGPVSLMTETAGTSVPGTATDQAGNTASASWGPVKIDLTSPSITGAVLEPANAANWHKDPVTVRFTCSDALSGVASCPADVVMSSDGIGQTLPGTAVDVAGNSRGAIVENIHIDRTPPVVDGARNPAANVHGWNNGAVTVAFTCTDALSGIASCAPASQTVAGEGAGQSASASATDVAGNSATRVVGDIHIDLTAPTVVASALPAPNFLGWNNTPVTAHFQCADALSGIDSCAPDMLFAGEGLFAASGAGTDRAGNVGQGSMLAIRIDLTPPVVTVPGAPLVVEATSAAGADVSFAASADDTVSGYLPGSLGCMTAAGAVVSGATFPIGTTAVTCAAMDLAGNVGTAGFSVVVQDTTAPVMDPVSDITAEATSPAGVAVTFAMPTATDAVAGALVSTCLPPSGSTFAVGSTTVTCSASDGQGNTGTAAFTVTVTAVASTPPTIGKVPGTNAQNQLIAYATSLQGAVVNYALPPATDAQGASVPVACAPAPGTTFAAGQNTVTCTATDSAGRTATATFTVWVQFQVALNATHGTAFLQPINPEGSSIFKFGSVVPVRFKLTGASAGIKTLVAYLTVTKISSTITGTKLESLCYSTPDKGSKFRYEWGDRHYEFNWPTSASSGTGTYEVRADLTDGNGLKVSDGVVHKVNISIKR